MTILCYVLICDVIWYLYGFDPLPGLCRLFYNVYNLFYCVCLDNILTSCLVFLADPKSQLSPLKQAADANVSWWHMRTTSVFAWNGV